MLYNTQFVALGLIYRSLEKNEFQMYVTDRVLLRAYGERADLGPCRDGKTVSRASGPIGEALRSLCLYLNQLQRQAIPHRRWDAP